MLEALRIPAGFGAIAQLGERYTGSVEVSGSIPLSSTIYFTGMVVFYFENYQKDF